MRFKELWLAGKGVRTLGNQPGKDFSVSRPVTRVVGVTRRQDNLLERAWGVSQLPAGSLMFAARAPLREPPGTGKMAASKSLPVRVRPPASAINKAIKHVVPELRPLFCNLMLAWISLRDAAGGGRATREAAGLSGRLQGQLRHHSDACWGGGSHSRAPSAVVSFFGALEASGPQCQPGGGGAIMVVNLQLIHRHSLPGTRSMKNDRLLACVLPEAGVPHPCGLPISSAPIDQHATWRSH